MSFNNQNRNTRGPLVMLSAAKHLSMDSQVLSAAKHDTTGFGRSSSLSAPRGCWIC